MKKILNLVMLILIAIGVISVVVWLLGGDVTGMSAKVDMMLYVAFAFLLLAVILMVAMTLMNMGKGRGNSKLGLLVFGGLAVLAVIIFFAFAKADVVTGADGKVFADAFTLKATDTGLILTYVALALAVVFLLGGVIRKAIK